MKAITLLKIVLFFVLILGSFWGANKYFENIMGTENKIVALNQLENSESSPTSDGLELQATGNEKKHAS